MKIRRAGMWHVWGKIEGFGVTKSEARRPTIRTKTSRSMSQLGTLASGCSTVKFTARMCTRLVMSAVHSYRGEVWLPSVQISAELFQYINNTVLCGKARAMSCCCVAAVSANQECLLGSAVKVTTFTWCSQPPGDGVQWQRHFVCSHMMWTVGRFLSCPLWEDGTFFWIQKQLSPTHWHLEISIFCDVKPSLGYCFPTLRRNAVLSIWGWRATPVRNWENICILLWSVRNVNSKYSAVPGLWKILSAIWRNVEIVSHRAVRGPQNSAGCNEKTLIIAVI